MQIQKSITGNKNNWPEYETHARFDTRFDFQ